MICDEPWFSFIRKGIKTVEGRKNSPKYKNIKKGDLIEFISPAGEKFQAVVKEIKSYHTLQDYLEDVGFQNALPSTSSIEEATAIYLQWSTVDEIRKHGFLGIFVELKEVQRT